MLSVWKALRELGEQPDSPIAQQVLGSVVEFPYQDDPNHPIVTIAAFSQGSPRLFVSTGFGVIGEGLSDETERAGQALLAAARPFAGRFQSEDKHALPGSNMARFALLTPAGVLAREETLAAVSDDKHELHPVLLAAGNLMVALVTEAQRKAASQPR